ncbi:MAG: synthase protein [Thermomicrobiales bacterium]|nr:synthase protein [Thermomicrobiales bacterium]
MQIQPSPQDRERLGAAGAATGLGCSVVVTVILFIGGGILVDRSANTAPTFTLIGVVVALVAAGYELYELSRVGRADITPGPLTRQIARVAPRRDRQDGRGAQRDNEE